MKNLLNKKSLTFIFALSIGLSSAYGQLSNKVDVWDFGAEKMDTAVFSNKLDSAIINSGYPVSVIPGSTGIVFPTTFSAGALSWLGGVNDRLRTTNTKLTRYDANIASIIGYTGRLYVNAAAAPGRYLSLLLDEDDIVTVVEKTDAGGKINFVYAPDPAAQTDAVVVTSNLDTLNFVAKAAGTYRIYDNVGKPSYYRIFRKDATYVTINGTVDTTLATGVPDGYGINFTNKAGKTWNAVVTNNTFNVEVPAGYAYDLSLSDANKYIISNGTSIEVTEATTSHNVAIVRVDLFTVNGSVTGLDSAKISKITLVYVADSALHKVYVPQPVIDAGAETYTVQLEANCEYRISALGLNDYYILNDSVTINPVDTTVEIVFLPKPVYNISINITGLTAGQISKLGLIFTNLNEPGYSYSFSSVTGIALRDGTYSVSFTGLDSVPTQLNLTSNLVISGADASKTLAFSQVKTWSFEDRVIPGSSTAYKGMLFTGIVASELSKGHLTAKPGATIKVPVDAGEKLKIIYYYTAAFSIEGGDTINTATNSTSIFEETEYYYSGAVAGFVTINIVTGATTTYITEVSKCDTVEYSPIIYVGSDKEYKTINNALDAIERMKRSNSDRVTVMIDPGNYEEMLVVNSVNVTFKNAATDPSISMTNKGVDIEANAVRITSYYGHGYSYFSMGTDQKWNADILRVNKENGYLSYENKGSGTTNGSYWNATVVINANGFEAEDIIFENSFNQYISKKESEDVVVMWPVGNKGLRPSDIGSTTVQNRSFVERAAAIAITNNTDKVVLNKCRVVGRQDAFFGGVTTRVVVYKGAVMGAVDYIFGGMTAVFYKTDLVMNTSDESVDAAYITAAQQTSGRGYLMYKCNIKSAVPGTETASLYYSKPGYFGRPWQANTSEVVFYNTLIDTTNFTGSEGKSLMSPAGWSSSLGGESNLMYEYGSIEKSGENNLPSRVTWSTVLTVDTLSDGTAITPFNFTKGNDGWDPIPNLVEANKIVLTVTADDKNKVYGTDNPEFTVGYEGFINNDNVLSLETNAIATSTATISSGAGSYAIIAGGAVSEDYSFNYINGTLTIEKAPLTITADDKTKTRGSENPAFTLSYDGFVNGDDASDITSPDISCNATNGSGVGEYAITLSGGSANNYELTFVGGILTVTAPDGIFSNVDTKTQIYPNPANSSITIKQENKSPVLVRIINNEGQVLLERSLFSNQESIDVSGLSKGIYFLSVQGTVYPLIIE